MAEEFDTSRARARHEEVMSEVRRVRDTLEREIINYYPESPTSEAQSQEHAAGIRKYLRQAEDGIRSALSRLE
jgi:hypothetical protein